MLKRRLLMAVAAVALLGGCTYDDRYRDDYVVGANVGYQDVYYDGYYDGYYGPFYDGYWGTDGFFYFSDVDGHFDRDAGRHFRHSPDAGFTPVHGHPEPRSDAMPMHP